MNTEIPAETHDQLDLREHLIELRPEEIATELEGWAPDPIRMVMLLLSDEVAATVIAESEAPLARTILEVTENERIPRILALLPPDDAADVLGHMSRHIRQTPAVAELLKQLPPETRARLVSLLEFEPDTAGGLMTPEFVAVGPDATLDGALEAIRQQEKAETVVYVFVTEPETRRLLGVLSVRDILCNPGSSPVQSVMERDIITCAPDDDQEEVARTFERHNLSALPVIDDRGTLLGVVTVDDALDVLDEEAEEDMLALAGVEGTHQTLEPLTNRVKARLPWLMVTMLCGLGIAWMLQDFEGLITEFAVLALFQPVILALGGSVGLQSSTIIVRGLAVDEIDKGRMGTVAAQELAVGLSIGLACGIAAAALTHTMTPFLGTTVVTPMVLGLTVGLSVVAGMTVATMIGTMVPLLLERVGVDPAMASGPFITVLSDCNSLLIFFGVASLLLHAA